MSQLLIGGGHRLDGEVAIQGAKNSVLPILAATLLTGGQVELRGCPRLRDVDASVEILRALGCDARWEGGSLTVDTAGLNGCTISDILMREMRSSVIFLGAILARCGQAELSYPGGCDVLWCHKRTTWLTKKEPPQIKMKARSVLPDRAFLRGGGKMKQKGKRGFIKIPQALLTDSRFKAISADAKLLYALMLDRASLSQRNGRYDKAG